MARRFTRRAIAAFTLVEMLVVMGVIVIIISFSAPAITGLSGAGDVSKSVYDIAGILEQARAYAMSNNTYVYVGFHEADANTDESTRVQQVAVAEPKVGGRVSVAVIARKDGTRGYDVYDTSTWGRYYAAGANFLTIGKVQRFNNLHIVDLDAPPSPATGSGMVRGPYDPNTPKVPDPYNLGSRTCESATPFEYPLGSDIGKGNFTFTRVIQYDPQGVARIQTTDNRDTIVKLIEIGLQQARGPAAPTPPPSATTGSIAALQIECMTGSTHIYRP